MPDLHGCVLGMFVAQGADKEQIHELGQVFRDYGARMHYLGVGAKTIQMLDGSDFETDVQAEEVSPGYYDGLIIPGGHDAASLMKYDEELFGLLQAFVEKRRPIGAIGEAVLLLADAGLLQGRQVAATGRVRKEAEKAGAIGSSEAVVNDRVIITAVGSWAVDEFCERFANEIQAYRMRDYGDETSIESFPGSDSVSGASL